MVKLKIILQYDGTAYQGYQVQPNGNTIQAELEKALLKLHGDDIIVEKNSLTTYAGRTDQGVHANGQVAAIALKRNLISLDKYPSVLNKYLPGDIRVIDTQETHPNFHPRFDAKVRQYRYSMIQSQRQGFFPNIKNHFYYWAIYQELDLFKLEKMLNELIGLHDFTSFCDADDSSQSKVREIFKLKLTNDFPYLYIDIWGNSFLKAMIRSIIGNAVGLVVQQKGENYLKEILQAKDCRLAQKRAPAKGLFLENIYYEKIFGERVYYNKEEF